jgi:hypothetical protein
MTRALVVYETMYGNTQAVAEAIADELSVKLPTELVEVGGAPSELRVDVRLLVVGGPTHAFGMSRSSTREDAAKQAGRAVISNRIGVREWLAALTFVGAPPAGAAFDTHVEHPKLLRHVGSAAAGIERRLRGLGVDVVSPLEHFWVKGSEGPIVDGELEKARGWADRLATSAQIALSARQ